MHDGTRGETGMGTHYEATWRQLGAAIDTLDENIAACPDELWGQRLWPEEPPHEDLSAAWYLAYHCIFWLDVHVHGGVEGFAPPPPYTLDEFDPAGVLPHRQYAQAEMRAYLADVRARVKAIIAELSEDAANRQCVFLWGTPTYAELLLYSMRHVQEHAAQLSLFLGQHRLASRGWVALAT